MLNGRMTDELEKVLKEKRLWPDEDNILTYMSGRTEENHKNLSHLASAVVMIQTEHILNISLERYCETVFYTAVAIWCGKAKAT
jgi:hypothetical protein